MDERALYRLDDLKIPAVCACCGIDSAPYRVPALGFAFPSMSTMYAVELGYCKTCKVPAETANDRSRAGYDTPADEKRLSLHVLLFLVLAGGWIAFKSITGEFHIGLQVGIGIGVAFVITLLVFLAPRLLHRPKDDGRRAPPGHACRTHTPVRVRFQNDSKGRLVSFTFDNDAFEAAFCLANQPITATA